MPDIVDQMKTLLGMGTPEPTPTPEPVVAPTPTPEPTPLPVTQPVAEPLAPAGPTAAAFAQLQQQIANQGEALTLLASRPVGGAAEVTPPAMPKRILQVGDTKSLTERLTQELASTPAGGDPFQIKYRNPNRWSI